jgi:PPM family protein phosphatase
VIRPGVDAAALTDVGCQRQNNEDSYLYWEAEDDNEFQRKGRLAIVADGMGGHEGGQEASHIAVCAIKQEYQNAPGDDVRRALLEGFQAAYRQIQERTLADASLQGMGTTCTAIVLKGRDLHYAHLGDSRLYRVRGEDVRQLTRDHSYVGRLVEKGIISAEEAETHPQRHILTAALGTGPEPAPETLEEPIPLQEEDTLILCTDGLWGVVNEEEIRQSVADTIPQRACQKLVQLAKERGGPDNITVQVLRIT